MAPTTAAAMGSVPVDKAGVGSAVINSMRQVGGSLGIAIMGTLVATSVTRQPGQTRATRAQFVDGYHRALQFGAAILLAGAVDRRAHRPQEAAARGRRRPRSRSRRRTDLRGSGMTQTASEKIVERVTTWPGVQARPGRGGELAFVVERREIGHLHGSRAAHFGFPKRVWARPIDSDDDVEDVIALLRLNYDRAVRAREHSPRSD